MSEVIGLALIKGLDHFNCNLQVFVSCRKLNHLVDPTLADVRVQIEFYAFVQKVVSRDFDYEGEGLVGCLSRVQSCYFVTN